MRIGQLAARTAVPAHTIRYYERQGLLPVARRTPGGYREYDADALDDVAFIRKAQGLGLSLGEIRKVMQVASRGSAPCGYVRRAVRRRLAEVEQRLQDLRERRATLRSALQRLDGTPRCTTGRRCGVIEAVDPISRGTSGRL